MIHPHDQDGGKANQEGGIARPLPAQNRGQVGGGKDLALRRLGHFNQVQHQQGDRHGEHAVAEGFDPPCLFFRGGGAVLLGHPGSSRANIQPCVGVALS